MFLYIIYVKGDYVKIFDMHVHSCGDKPEQERLLRELNEAGVWGCCVFSKQPKLDKKCESSFEERLNEVLSWKKGYEDRIFSVLWIHPDEESIIDNIKVAVDAGIDGFKMICNNYYVYEEKCIRLLKEIAKYNKPVIFHSGILWDGGISSSYNRPLFWEAIMDIEGLRFSMGHCSWPWIDECLALYGKFLNSFTVKNTAEMFFDITPGTPKIYREELLTKLCNIGYDVSKNIMFGTDCSVETYSSAWAGDWLKTDKEIFIKLGVSKENFENIYYNNVLRFFGKTDVKVSHLLPVTDNSNAVTMVNQGVKEISEKWYKKLGFPREFDGEFYEALQTIPLSDFVNTSNYDYESKDGIRNLLYFLYMCEEVSENYKKLGISDKILMDTLSDIVIWCKIWSSIKKCLYLGEISWLSHSMKCQLFKLGRLQFCFGKADEDVEGLGISKGDNLIEVHIPEVGPLDMDECKKSFEMATEFFKKFFPDFKYKYFTCHSWLLDNTLKEILPDTSNIISFGNLFTKTKEDEDNALVRYLFGWDKKPYEVNNFLCNSSLQKNVRKYLLDGKNFHVTRGYFKY